MTLSVQSGTMDTAREPAPTAARRTFRGQHAVAMSLGSAATLLLGALTVDALLPRPYWPEPPAWRTDPAFELSVGAAFALDKPEHAAAGFVCTLLVAVSLHLGLSFSRRAAAATALLGVAVLWAGTVEVVQGFLAYRNFELLDLAATFLGGIIAIACWFAAAFWSQRRKAVRAASKSSAIPASTNVEPRK